MHLNTIASLSSVFLLFSNASTPTAPAQTTSVTVVEYSQKLAIEKMPASLPWSANLQAVALKIIAGDATRLRRALTRLSGSGADLVRTARFDNLPNKSLGGFDIPSAFTLVGYRLNGKTVGKEGPFPSDPKDLGSSSTRLNALACRLPGTVIKSESSKPIPSCKVTAPSASAYLKNALIGHVVFSQPSDLYGFRIQELNYIVANNLKFSIRGGQIVCPELSKLSPNETAISLSDKSAIGGYTITVTQDGSGFTFTENAPDFVRLARSAYVLPGETWIRFQ